MSPSDSPDPTFVLSRSGSGILPSELSRVTAHVRCGAVVAF